MKIRVFEAFAGYGSQSLALERLKQTFPEFDYEVVGISEIDKYALTAYEALHGHCPNYGDISKIDWNNVPDFDLFTYSFPCTDISSAGKQEGLKEGSGTRSSLLWECKRDIEIKRPKHLLMENVKALVSEKFLPFFLDWERYLRSLGYMNYSEVLNAKDYGVPQNRERIFMVSTLETETYHFPKPFKLELRLKDVLEQEVPDKYYLSEKAINGFTQHNKNHEKKGTGFMFEPKRVDNDD
jgi:DNA (cytosine-5)-methyltransferase 1